MGRRSETGGVKPQGDRIAIRITYQGSDIQPTLALKPTAANLKHARRLREGILEEMKVGTFRIADHFPDYRFAERYTAVDDPGGRTLKDWADVWHKLAARDLEHSTLKIYKRHLDAYWLAEFGGMKPRAVTYERLLTHLATLAVPGVDPTTGKVSKGLSRKTQNNILIPLRAVFDLICKAPGAPPNPTEGIDNLKVQTGDPDPFTLEEVEIALHYVRTKSRGAAEMADYFEFAAFAGLRPSEQISLLWADVDLRNNTVLVRRSRVLSQDKERTKTNRQRIVELNARAAATIERQRARTQLVGAHVFLNPITNGTYQGEQFQAREWMQALRVCGVRHRPPKELRDTSVTLNLSSGADAYWVAAQHGHSVITMLKDYAKWIPKVDKGRNLEAMNLLLSARAAGG